MSTEWGNRADRPPAEFLDIAGRRLKLSDKEPLGLRLIESVVNDLPEWQLATRFLNNRQYCHFSREIPPGSLSERFCQEQSTAHRLVGTQSADDSEIIFILAQDFVVASDLQALAEIDRRLRRSGPR